MLAVAYVLGLFAATGAVLYLAHRLLGDSADGSWEAEAAALAREVHDAVGEDYRTAQRRLVPLASRIDGHLRAAPPDVDDRLLGRLHELGVECRAVSMEHPYRESSETLEAKFDALETAARAVERKAER